MTRICAIIFIALVTAACSAEEPASQSEPVVAETPTAAEQQSADTIDDETSIAQAQEMDEAEAVTDDDNEEDLIVVAEATPEKSELPPQLERYQPGTHYRVMTPVQPTSVDPGKVEVLEIFWYGCPHCYTLEPHAREWVDNEMPSNAEFVRIPATLNRGWQVHARAY